MKMPARIAPRQSDVTRLLKGAKNAGFCRARIISHPDGRVELIGETIDETVTEQVPSAFKDWKNKNAGKN